jgi:hypothetical protein
MGIDISNYGINTEFVERKNKKQFKDAKEFDNLEDALKHSAKDEGDEAILHVKDDKGKDKFIVVDINKDVKASELFEPNNLRFESAIISRDKKTVEFVNGKSSGLDSSINDLEQTAIAVQGGKVSGLNKTEGLNPEKAVVYSKNLETIDRKFQEITAKIREKLASMPEGKDKDQLQFKLDKLETRKELMKSEKLSLSCDNLKTQLWTARTLLADNNSLRPLCEVDAGLKEKELAGIMELLNSSKYSGAKEGSFYYKEGIKLKNQAKGLEDEIKFLKKEPPPTDDQVMEYKNSQLKELQDELAEAKPGAKGKIKDKIAVLQKEIDFLNVVKPWSAEKKEAQEKRIASLDQDLTGTQSVMAESGKSFLEKSAKVIPALQKELDKLNEEMTTLKSAKQLDVNAIKAKAEEIAQKEHELFPLNNQVQDIIIAEGIAGFEKAGTPEEKDKFANQVVEAIAKKMSKYCTSAGDVRATTARDLGTELLQSLQDEGIRKVLIHKFKVDTPANLDILVLTMGAEAHGGLDDANWQDAKPMTPEKKVMIKENVATVGAAALNRYLSTIMVKSAEHYAKNGGKMDDFKPPSLESVMNIGRGTNAPLVAYAALTPDQIKTRLEKMKDSKGAYTEYYKVDETAAKALLRGEVNLIMREKVYIDPADQGKKPNISDPGAGKMTIKVKNNDDGTFTVNTGTLFNYVSPADTIPIMDMNRGWVQSPNKHKLGTYSPNSEGSFYRLPGIPKERDNS